MYMVYNSRYFAGIAYIKIQYFLQPIDGDKTSRVEITKETYQDFKKERMADKYSKSVYLDLRRSTGKEVTEVEESFIGGKDEEKEKKE